MTLNGHAVAQGTKVWATRASHYYVVVTTTTRARPETQETTTTGVTTTATTTCPTVHYYLEEDERLTMTGHTTCQTRNQMVFPTTCIRGAYHKVDYHNFMSLMELLHASMSEARDSQLPQHQ